MSPVHRVLPQPSCEAQWKGKEDEADRRRGWKTTSGNGQAWSLPSPRGQWRTRKNGEDWFKSHLWCTNDPHGWGIDDDDDGCMLGLHDTICVLIFYVLENVFMYAYRPVFFHCHCYYGCLLLLCTALERCPNIRMCFINVMYYHYCYYYYYYVY